MSADLDQPVWLNTAQAARRAGRHVITVRRALEAAELHGAQRTTGGRWRIHVDCLDAWAASTDCPHKAAEPSSKTA